MIDLIDVSKAEFNDFVTAHQPLKSEFSAICEPPALRYYNESGTVAVLSKDWMGPNGEIDRENTGKFWSYRIAASSGQEKKNG